MFSVNVTNLDQLDMKNVFYLNGDLRICYYLSICGDLGLGNGLRRKYLLCNSAETFSLYSHYTLQ